jgi:nitrite reductase/ring-hydroxylating ferredoxin subunit
MGQLSFRQWALRSPIEARTPEGYEVTKMPEYVTIARVSTLPPGMGRVVTVKGHELAVFNRGGTFHAMDNRCPHQDYPLGMSPIFDNSVVCIGHAWRFDIKSGACHTVPGVQVRTYDVLIEGDEVKIKDDSVPDQPMPHL